jgi:hypothetical protein
MARCPAEEEWDEAMTLLSDSSGCERWIQTSESPRLDGLIADVEAGRITYDGAAFRACLDRTFADCTFTTTFPGDLSSVALLCPGAFQGSAPMGGACTGLMDCGPDAWCDARAQCPGVCSARLAVGEVCVDDTQCAQGADPVYCDVGLFVPRAGGPSRCQVLKRAPAADLGAACGGSPRDPEVTITPCQEGLYCRNETCLAPTPLGGDCSEGPGCSPGARCQGQSANGSQGPFTCQAIAVSTVEGAACDNRLQDCDASKGLYCTSGQCVRGITDGGSGTPCKALADYVAGCGPGLYCDGNQCAAKLALTMPCVRDAECVSGGCAGGACVATACGINP